MVDQVSIAVHSIASAVEDTAASIDNTDSAVHKQLDTYAGQSKVLKDMIQKLTSF